MIWELISLALNNLQRARVRLAMTTAGVVIGTTAVVLLIALTNGLQTFAEGGLGSASLLTEIYVYEGTDPNNSLETLPLNEDAVAELATIAGVQAVVPTLSFRGQSELQADELRNYATIIGVPPEQFAQLEINVAQGQYLIDESGVVVGADIPDYFLDPEASVWEPLSVDIMSDPPRLKITSYTGRERVIALTINGILQGDTSRFDSALLLPLETIIEWNAWLSDERPDPENTNFDQLIIRATSRETTRAIADAISARGYEVDSVGNLLDEINTFFGTMRLVLGAVGSIALIVAAVGVGNTMSISIIERTREIGLMKAIGARDRDVMLVFLAEAGLVGFLGGVIGVGVSLFIGDAINNTLSDAAQSGTGNIALPFSFGAVTGDLIIIPTDLILLSIMLATLIAVIAGSLPALRAARLSPVNALKYE